MRIGSIETAVHLRHLLDPTSSSTTPAGGCVGVRDGHPVLLSHCSPLGYQDLAEKAVFFIRLR